MAQTSRTCTDQTRNQNASRLRSEPVSMRCTVWTGRKWSASVPIATSRASMTLGLAKASASSATKRARCRRNLAFPLQQDATDLLKSSASRVNHPTVSRLGDKGTIPSVETRPNVGLMPKSPHNAAGSRTEQAVSLPSAKSTSPPATALADPLDDPPGRGRRHQIHRSSVAFAQPPSPARPFGLAARAAVSSRWRAVAVRWAGPCVRRQSGLPAPVTCPATSKTSFAANIRPANGPIGAPSSRTRASGQNAPNGSLRAAPLIDSVAPIILSTLDCRRTPGFSRCRKRRRRRSGRWRQSAANLCWVNGCVINQCHSQPPEIAALSLTSRHLTAGDGRRNGPGRRQPHQGS